MPTYVEMDIYSGLPNPEWELSEGEERNLQELIERFKKPTLSVPPGVLPRLGYRGFIIKNSPGRSEGGITSTIRDGVLDLKESSFNFVADDRDLELFLLETVKVELPDVVTRHVAIQIAEPLHTEEFLRRVERAGPCLPTNAADSPAYSPGLWNNNANTRYKNNCYNYANDQITNTFAQPGFAHGVNAGVPRCTRYRNAAQADGLITAPDFTTSLDEGDGWYVALVIWPGADMHWYRQDSNGCWSHKIGSSHATRYDHSGDRISDPETCDRGDYTNFCGFMITNSAITIEGPL